MRRTPTPDHVDIGCKHAGELMDQPGLAYPSLAHQRDPDASSRQRGAERVLKEHEVLASPDESILLPDRQTLGVGRESCDTKGGDRGRRGFQRLGIDGPRHQAEGVSTDEYLVRRGRVRQADGSFERGAGDDPLIVDQGLARVDGGHN